MPEIAVGEILLTLGLTLFVGYFVKRIMGRLKVPDVTGYIILGVLAGAFIFSRFEGLLDSVEIISDFALAIIAFIIGHELKKDVIKKLGKAILFIAIFEAFGAFLVVFSVLYFFNFFPLHSSLLLASIASATAPAATVYVIHQYKSEGPLTSTILAVVGIDDAIALIIYVFASTVAKQTFHGNGEAVFNLSLIVTPILSVLSSGVLGVVSGLIFRFLFNNIRNRDALAMGIVGFVLIVMGGAELMGISELLSVMVFSAFLTNTSVSLSRRSGEIIESFTSIMLPFFFIFAGAHLDVMKISSIALVCIIYFFARSVGKIGGASIGGLLGKAPTVVRKFAGLGLIPQVGVAVALALAVKRTFGDPTGPYGQDGADMAAIIINILLCSTIITESVGPILTKFALKKAGEAKAD
jgi:Kef-type K+ transport system membrane component KefB